MERPVYRMEPAPCEQALVDEEMEGEEGEELGETKVLERMDYEWGYFEDEEAFDTLVESLNTKGIRERKLQENLRKLKERLKLKRSTKKAVPVQQQKSADANGQAEKA